MQEAKPTINLQCLKYIQIQAKRQPRAKEQLAQFTADPPLRQIVDVLRQAMCAHDAEKLAIAVLEIYEDRNCEERSSAW